MAVEIIRQQIADIDALAKRKGREPPSWIFPAPGARAPVSPTAPAHALKRAEQRAEGNDAVMVLGIAPFTPHDLRRTAATHMEGLGVSPHVIGHVLNHVSATKATITTQVYARYDYMKEKREALELLADRLDGIIKGAAAVVTPLRKGAL
jgi:integrase